MLILIGLMITFLFWHISVIQKDINQKIYNLEESQNKHFYQVREEHRKKYEQLEKRFYLMHKELDKIQGELEEMRRKDEDDLD